MADLAITVAGELLDRRLCHFCLVHSGFEYGHVVLGVRATWAWPKDFRNFYGFWAVFQPAHRSDSLSAAFRNLDDDARADLTTRYDALCAHYGMEPTRNNPGVPMRTFRPREPTGTS